MTFGCCGSMIRPTADPIGISIARDMARMGFDYIELSLSHMAALSDADFRDLCSRLECTGIPCESCNNFFPPTVRLTGSNADLGAAMTYATAALSRAAQIGAKVVVFGSSGAKNVPAGFPHDAAWRQIAELLRHIGPLAASHSITLAIEPLNRAESNIVNTIPQAMHLVREVGHPNAQLLVDYYQLAMEHEDLSVIHGAGPAIRHVHVAQIRARTFPLEWDAGMAAFFDSLRSTGYDGRCSIEAYTDSFTADAPQALRLLKASVPGPASPGAIA